MKSFNYNNFILAITMLTLGCDSAAERDAAASVDGEVITRMDLNLEATALNDGAGSGTPEFQRQLLTQIVNRKLLAREAVAQRVDVIPAFKAAELKARETALADALIRKLVGARSNPTPAAIDAFIAENPAMFRAREVLSLDQLQVEAADVNNDWLRPANSLADAARILKEHNVAFQSGRATADTSMLAPQLLKMLADRPGEPFAVPQNGKLVISQVTDRRPVVVAPEQIKAIAATEIRRRAYQEQAETMLRTLNAKAKITFGDGLSPTNFRK